MMHVKIPRCAATTRWFPQSLRFSLGHLGEFLNDYLQLLDSLGVGVGQHGLHEVLGHNPEGMLRNLQLLAFHGSLMDLNPCTRTLIVKRPFYS
jgi:hypothetical protein